MRVQHPDKFQQGCYPNPSRLLRCQGIDEIDRQASLFGVVLDEVANQEYSYPGQSCGLTCESVVVACPLRQSPDSPPAPSSAIASFISSMVARGPALGMQPSRSRIEPVLGLNDECPFSISKKSILSPGSSPELCGPDGNSDLAFGSHRRGRHRNSFQCSIIPYILPYSLHIM